MTKAERQALCFLAGVALLGGGVRAWRGVGEGSDPAPADRRALKAQLAAVDSAVAEEERRRAGKANRGRGRRKEGGAGGGGPRTSRPPEPPPVVDVDRASAAELEALPRIGPALARRIVADRDSLGPFGSLEGLQRVRGIGPRLAEGLVGRVTFSGTPRRTGAAGVPDGTGPPPRARPGRRRSAP